MDALELLEQDHDTVKSMFEKFKAAAGPKERRQLLEQIFTELETHTRIEEEIFYPAIAEEASEEETVRESLEEHHLVDTIIAELREMDPGDEQYAAKATVLIENVEHHIEEEEGEMFPSVRQSLGADRLRRLGEEMQRAKGEGSGGSIIDLTRDELYEKAQELGIEGRSEMNKEQLAEAVRAARR